MVLRSVFQTPGSNRNYFHAELGQHVIRAGKNNGPAADRAGDLGQPFSWHRENGQLTNQLSGISGYLKQINKNDGPGRGHRAPRLIKRF